MIGSPQLLLMHWSINELLEDGPVGVSQRLQHHDLTLNRAFHNEAEIQYVRVFYTYWFEGNRKSNKLKYLVIVSLTDFPVKVLSTSQESVQDHREEPESEPLQLMRSSLKAAERARHDFMTRVLSCDRLPTNQVNLCCCLTNEPGSYRITRP